MSSAVVVFAGVGGSFCTLWVVEGGVGVRGLEGGGLKGGGGGVKWWGGG
jgi:hypothetical protein